MASQNTLPTRRKLGPFPSVNSWMHQKKLKFNSKVRKKIKLEYSIAYKCNVTPNSLSSRTDNNGDMISFPASSYTKIYRKMATVIKNSRNKSKKLPSSSVQAPKLRGLLRFSPAWTSAVSASVSTHLQTVNGWVGGSLSSARKTVPVWRSRIVAAMMGRCWE